MQCALARRAAGGGNIEPGTFKNCVFRIAVLAVPFDLFQCHTRTAAEALVYGRVQHRQIAIFIQADAVLARHIDGFLGPLHLAGIGSADDG